MSDTGILAPSWAGTTAAGLLTDEAWAAALVDVELGLVRAQTRQGIVPAGVAPALAETFRSDLDLPALARSARDSANPVVALVRALTAAAEAADPATARFVHLGGTSQDIMDSAAMLLSRRVLLVLVDDLRTAAKAAAGLARAHRDTVMAGRTLTQHAVPITFGLKAAGWLMLLLDAVERAERLARDGLPVQLGGAAGTLAGYAEYAGQAGLDGPAAAVELAGLVAGELGLPPAPLPWHTARAPLADLGAVLAFVTGALGKIALDVQGMARTEVGEVSEPAAEGRGSSSAMPQKRNPVLATLIVAAGRQVPALASILHLSMLAEDERAPGAWQAEWQPLRESLRLAAGAAAAAGELLRGLTVHPAAMRANLGRTDGAIVAERLSAVLAPALGKADAKRLLGGLSRQSAAEGRPYPRVLAEDPAVRAGLAKAGVSLDDVLDPDRYLGAAGLLVDRALRRYAELAGPHTLR